MKGETGERWRKLCEMAAQEQDPQRLVELVDQIDRMLAEKDQRLRERHKQATDTASDPSTE